MAKGRAWRFENGAITAFLDVDLNARVSNTHFQALTSVAMGEMKR